MDIVQVAQRIADDVLFPAALATDASDVLPRELLDALAGAGLYGVVAPPEAGGAGADFPALCAVQEALASGCLTTAFVWAQHNGLVRALADGGDPELTAKWLAPLARGEIRAGVALAGMLPRPPLRASPDAGGWRLDGVAPFVSGWGRIDVIHVAARAGDEIVWLLVDAAEGPSVRAERLKLAALNATATVRVTFGQLPVAATWMTSIRPQPETNGATPSSRHPPASGLARNGGRGSCPASATPARTSPRASGASQRAVSSAGPPSASARTSPLCCAQPKAVVRQPLARTSWTAQRVRKSAPRPPASCGATTPYSPAPARASSSSRGTTSPASVARAEGNSTSSAIR